MKKNILTMLIIGMLYGIVGCGTLSEKETHTENPTTEEMQKDENTENLLHSTEEYSTEEKMFLSDPAVLEILGTPIQEQTFEVVLNDWGEVTFASFAPQNSSFVENGLNPDVRFCLVQDGEVLCEMPGWNEEHTNENMFMGVTAIAFKDYNDDGLLDVITLCEYEVLSGEGIQTARIYFQLKDKKGFVEDTLLTEYLTKNNKTENIAVILEAKEAYWDYNRSMEGYQSIYNQLQIMAENKDLWIENLEFADELYQYAVTDLDHNGRYEVIVSNMGGTGHYTYSRFFEMNENYDGLVECETDFVEGDSQPDIVSKEWKNYIDKDGECHYAVYDLAKNGATEYYENVRDLSLKNGKIQIEPIAFKTTIYNGETPTVTCTDANGNTITEEDYERAVDEYFAGVQENITCLGWQNVRELDEDISKAATQLEASLNVFLW